MSFSVFVSTTETQGQRTNDFCYVPEGELVIPPSFTCSSETTDGPCGSKRSWGGVTCHKATTTMKVAKWTEGRAELDHAIATSLQDAGYLATTQYVNFVATTIIDEASNFTVGTIVEYRNEVFLPRSK